MTTGKFPIEDTPAALAKVLTVLDFSGRGGSGGNACGSVTDSTVAKSEPVPDGEHCLKR